MSTRTQTGRAALTADQLTDDVAVELRDARRLLDELPRLAPDHESVRLAVVALRQTRRALAVRGSASEDVIADARELLARTHAVLAQARQRHARQTAAPRAVSIRAAVPEARPASRNAVVAALPASLREELLRVATRIQPQPGDVLQEVGRQPQHAVFPETGVASVIATLPDGEVSEAALVGRDGFVGTSLLLHAPARTTRVVWQSAGSGLAVRAADFVQIVSQHPQSAPYRYIQALHDQLAQVGACNRRHSIRQRAARWLLMVADRTDGDRFELTHELLAQMLGAGRPKVTLAAQQLQRSGLITYRRGAVTVTDRAGLREAACECYSRLAALLAD